MKTSATQLGWMLLVAGAYFVVGKLALLMAIPPGYATAVWPPAGLALVALLCGGYRLAPAVALGSFFVNVHGSFPLTGSLVAASLGVGAALQAVVATFLVRRFVGYPNALERTGDVIRLLALGGPVACLTASTWGVGTLLVAGLVSEGTFAVSWSTWWVGDTIGVVIFAPVLFAFLGEPRAAWRRRRISVGLPLLIGSAVVSAVFVKNSQWEDQRLSSEFARRADVLSHAVARQTGIYLDVAAAVTGLYQASEVVTRDELQAFARPVMARHRGLLAMTSIARVPASQRSAFEQSRHAIVERGPSRSLVRAADWPEYFPVDEVAPYESNRVVLGFDLGSEPVRLAALEQARDSGKAAASGQIYLVQESFERQGVLFVVPAYRPGAPVSTREGRRANLSGYSSIAVRTTELIDVALRDVDRSGVHLRLLDEAATGDGRVLYDDLREGVRSAGTSSLIEVAGRTWRVESEPTPEFVAAQRSWQAWMVLAGGLFFMSLLGAILLIVTGNEIRLADAEGRYRDLYDHSPDMYVSVSADTGLVLDCNETVFVALGRSREAIIGHPVLDLYEPACHESAHEALARFRESGELSDVELQLRRDHQPPLDVSLSVTAMHDTSGRIVRNRLVWRDITARRQVERDDALKIAIGDALRSMDDVDSLAAMVAGRVGDHLGVARCFFCEVDVEREILIIHRDFHRDLPSLAGEKSLASHGRETQAELQAGRTVVIRDAATDPRTAERYAAAYAAQGLHALLGVPLVREGRWVATLWVTHDAPRAWSTREVVLLQSIAERTWVWIEHARLLGRLRELNLSLEQRVAERTRDLETSVHEKDVLLREIHHRVKNNLQVISSLLNLQAMASEDAPLQRALADSRDRIQSLALVHDQLYRAANAATIELDRYLRELILSIERAQGQLGRIRIEVDAAPCSLPLDQAVPCGLIVNELITNSLKHAFPEGRTGTITVSARPGDAQLHLAVRDDGVGLPATFDLAASTGLGMVIVDTLSRQLGATLTIGRDGGAVFELSIPLGTPE